MSKFETLNPVKIDDAEVLGFDFDGTLANSLGAFNETIAEILGREPAGPKELEEIRGLPAQDIPKYLDITPWQTLQLLRKTRRGIAGRMDQVEMFAGMGRVIKEASESGRKIYIVSSNRTSTIEDAVNRYGIGSYISQIHGDVSLLGKANRLRRVLRNDKLNADNMLYVGDEVRDIEATRKVGMKCISVAWGYNTLAALQKGNPAAIALTPEDLGNKLKFHNNLADI